jgi:peroxiredoxin
MPRLFLPIIATMLLTIGCSGTPSKVNAPPSAPPETKRSAPATPGEDAAPTVAEVGQPAPDFTLTTYEGETVRLSDLRGKVVVLEWFNPQCPFVKYVYEESTMAKTIQNATDKGVVWIGINSGAPGRQGHGSEVNLTAKKRWGLKHAIAPDPEGNVGRAYNASRTPEIFVITADGILAYAGAYDTSRGATPEPNTPYTHYTKEAIDAVLAGQTPDPATTKAWGCTVKYR